jgi:hypothetical protein
MSVIRLAQFVPTIDRAHELNLEVRVALAGYARART